MELDTIAFNKVREDLAEMAWGGKYINIKNAPEGSFYPFVRCVQRSRPVDRGIVWLGTRYEYPRIHVENMVAEWLCPYSASGLVVTEPFETLSSVVLNWARLTDCRHYPDLRLPPVPPL